MVAFLKVCNSLGIHINIYLSFLLLQIVKRCLNAREWKRGGGGVNLGLVSKFLSEALDFFLFNLEEYISFTIFEPYSSVIYICKYDTCRWTLCLNSLKLVKPIIVLWIINEVQKVETINHCLFTNIPQDTIPVLCF